MSRFFTTITLSLAIIAGIFSLTVSPISANAQSITGNVIAAKAGTTINYRDQNCKIIKTLNATNALFVQPGEAKITCTINGTKYNMIKVSGLTPRQTGYVAENLVTTIGNVADGGNSTKVNSVSGLNIRDSNCKKLGVISNNTSVSIPNTDNFGGVCVINGKIFHMMPITYKGSTAFVASLFLK